MFEEVVKCQKFCKTLLNNELSFEKISVIALGHQSKKSCFVLDCREERMMISLTSAIHHGMKCKGSRVVIYVSSIDKIKEYYDKLSSLLSPLYLIEEYDFINTRIKLVNGSRISIKYKVNCDDNYDFIILDDVSLFTEDNIRETKVLMGFNGKLFIVTSDNNDESAGMQLINEIGNDKSFVFVKFNV